MTMPYQNSASEPDEFGGDLPDLPTVLSNLLHFLTLLRLRDDIPESVKREMEYHWRVVEAKSALAKAEREAA
jgi:hypothetical protein